MKQFLNALFPSKAVSKAVTSTTPEAVTVVSGLPRSGTSMMMKMLEAGGMPIVTDNRRTADSDNPEGYYEFERVKQLDKGDYVWLDDARGRAVKVISALLEHLPSDHVYDVIFIHRKLEEVLASQKKMLINRGEDPNKVSDNELIQLFKKHKSSVLSWLHRQPNIRLLEVDYAQLLSDPQPNAEQISQFLGGHLNVEAMTNMVNSTLYRNRSTTSRLVNTNA